jgi:acyl-CoA synthetase (AMP-forming)/AMP-acid ligase II
MLPTAPVALGRAAQYFADRPAIRYEGKVLLYREAWERGLRFAAALRDMGLEPRDRIATLEDNRIGAIDTYLGAAAANIVRAPLYPRNSIEAHAHMLTITEAKALFIDQEMVTDEILKLTETVPSLKHIVVRDDRYENWLKGFLPVSSIAESTESDLHIIRFSGGTTGLPKAIPLTNRVWMSQMRDIAHIMPPPEPGDVCLHAGTLSHGSGYLFIPTWITGGINELLVGFEAEKVIDALEVSKVSFAFLAPSQLAALCRAKNAEGRNFDKLKALWIAGAPISPETALLSRKIFGERVYPTFNQTEVALAVVMTPQEWFSEPEGSKPLEAAGRIFAWAQLEIRDENNRPLGVGETGEIAIRAEGQMDGYIGPPELSKDKIVDGWILTGDIGYLDKNGFLYIVDRKGATIISGGYNIYPAELERVIGSLPGVLEVAVVPIPDERWGETPLAVCVVKPEADVTEQLISDVCKQRLGSYKKPGRIIIQRERLPMTPVGKIDRRAIKEPYWAGLGKRVAGT